MVNKFQNFINIAAPHLSFLCIAGLLYWGVWVEEHGDGPHGGWIDLTGLLSALYYLVLSSYLLSYAFSVWLIRRNTGKWRLGLAYLVAFIFAPVCYFLVGIITVKLF